MDVALFGAGRIGKIHAGNVARQPGVTLRYVVDVDAAAAKSLAQQHGAQVGSVEAALADNAVGAVVIGSSTDTHSDLITRSAAAGKAIFCEKPVDLSVERAQACADAVKRAGVACMIGFNRRYDPTFAAVKERLVQGEVGDPEMLVVTSRDPSRLQFTQSASDSLAWMRGNSALPVTADQTRRYPSQSTVATRAPSGDA